MAKDGIKMTLHGGAKLDRKLAKIANIKQSKATKMVNDSLKNASAEVGKTIRTFIPQSKKGASGWKTYDSRNHPKGALRRSIRWGLLNKVQSERTSFIAGVFIANAGGKGKLKSKGARDDGWFAPFFMGDKHRPNAHGFTGGRNVIDKGVKSSSGKFIKTIGSKLGNRIKNFMQKELG